MNHSYDTLAHVAYATARRIDPVDGPPAVTKADAAQIATNARRSWTPAPRKPGLFAGFRRRPSSSAGARTFPLKY